MNTLSNSHSYEKSPESIGLSNINCHTWDLQPPRSPCS
jgi:hypothetical protein